MGRVACVLAAAAVVQAVPDWITLLDLNVGAWESSLCSFDAYLDGAVLLPDAKCCNGTVIAADAVCEGDLVNAGLSFPGGQITGDCVWKQSTVVIAARSTQDVEWAVQLFAHFNVKFTTRCGGHSGSCASTCHGCATITTLHMKDAEIVTPPSSTHTYTVAQAGITISDLVLTYNGSGHMVPHGNTGSICIVGHFLGGGMGDMTRKYGFTSDYVVGVEIVLADGQAIRTFAEEHEEALSGYKLASWNPEHRSILWALKGSGHFGLGIVTKMWLRMAPQPKYVVQGIVKFAIHSAEDAKLFFAAQCQYFGEAYDDTVETSNLQVWSRVFPILDLSTGLPPAVHFTITYVPDNDATEAAALAEGMAEINKFLSPATSAPIESTISVVSYDKKFEGSTKPSNFGLDGTCSSKVFLKKQDVCDDAEWLDAMAERIWTTVQPENWYAVQELPYIGIEKFGGAAYYNDPHHIQGTMSTRSAWTAFEYCRWRLNPADPWTNIQDKVVQFNEEHLLPISHVYYKNYADYMVTDVRDLYPDPYIFHNLRRLKEQYDPADLFSKDGAEPSVL